MSLIEPDHISSLRENIRRFLEKEATREMVEAWDRDDLIPPRPFMAKLAELGVFHVSVAEEYGGAGVDLTAMVVTIEELSRRSMQLAAYYIEATFYGALNIAECGTEAQKQRFLPDLAEGKLLFAYGLSEPDTGASLADVKTRAERRGDTVVINGFKRWCTGASTADYIYMLVRSGPAEAKRKNLSFVIVPVNSPGITITSIETMGAKGVPTNDVALDDVEIPFDLVVGGESGWDNGWSMLVGPALEAEKLEVPALALGVAEAVVEEAWQYSQERRQGGKAICSYQAIRHQLADAQTKLEACRLMLYNAVRLLEEKRPSAAETSMAKLFITETAVEIALTCQKILGAYGYARGFQMERHVRDILVTPIWGGSTNIQLNNIANLMGLPR
ncbi:alkylation response protein AidB-like acyl-CoA dehydrogenase [Sphingomonas jinjuensis]|uniref:Alkylation response protein AidB-like acyl-CoA dehydrogenase n=1 Tax=Sphingomonas jinjuensis TaxID=535907 RepID=A0A840FE41_9SPHN|nr:acyl-CoA dehydrogenase family protein [Sphingomonas jinjuensis]MBB4155081.1 alkylation response protein AidB-like acyl-CoA dehydrogenase [Sphingomonas jinjuensis]